MVAHTLPQNLLAEDLIRERPGVLAERLRQLRDDVRAACPVPPERMLVKKEQFLELMRSADNSDRSFGFDIESLENALRQLPDVEQLVDLMPAAKVERVSSVVSAAAAAARLGRS